MSGDKVAVGQAGGPTAVINASLAGFVAAAGENGRIYGIEDGFQGLAQGRLRELDRKFRRSVIRHRDVPGACLGAGRWPMSEESFTDCIRHLRERDIRKLAMIGGNGTMWSCLQLHRMSRQLNCDLAIVGIPKTVDNDIAHTDHAPGYGSAARYVALAVRDIGQDLKSMRNFEQVRIVETMGRNAGWLAAAGGLLKERPEEAPHLLYVPERPLDIASFVRDVETVVKETGYAVVVVGEGVRDPSGTLYGELTLRAGERRQVLGGAAHHLARHVSEQLGFATRAEMLGISQRCFAQAVSLQDRREAEMLGKAALEALEQGESGIMLNLLRVSGPGEPYAFRIGSCPLSDAAGLERPMPASLLADCRLSAASHHPFRSWLRPLVGIDISAYPPALFQETQP